MSMKKSKRLARLLRWALTVVLMGIIGYCGLNIWTITSRYRQEAALHADLLMYKPLQAQPDDEPPAAASPGKANQGLTALRERNEDVVGWIVVPGTKIDYPFVQAADNAYYLDRDIDRQHSAAGTLFLDARNDAQLSDFNSFIYGHSMKNGSMFGSLGNYASKAFFDKHAVGTIHLDNDTYELEFFAHIIVTSQNAMIYAAHEMGSEWRREYFAYVAAHARNYRDIGLMTGDKIITLSSCAYEFDDARMVLLARLNPTAMA